MLGVGQVWGAIPIVYADEAPKTKAEAAPVRINRTLPAGQGVPSPPIFSSPPTDAEVARVDVFDEPLVPIGRATTPAENQALVAGIQAYIRAGGGEDVAPLENLLATNPETPWRGAPLSGLGIVYRHTGYFSKALAAWTSANGARDRPGIAIADRAPAELAELNAGLGRSDRLEVLHLVGSAAVGAVH
jgi:hypothetical protein